MSPTVKDNSNDTSEEILFQGNLFQDCVLAWWTGCQIQFAQNQRAPESILLSSVSQCILLMPPFSFSIIASLLLCLFSFFFFKSTPLPHHPHLLPLDLSTPPVFFFPIYPHQRHISYYLLAFTSTSCFMLCFFAFPLFPPGVPTLYIQSLRR